MSALETVARAMCAACDPGIRMDDGPMCRDCYVASGGHERSCMEVYGTATAAAIAALRSLLPPEAQAAVDRVMEG